LVLAGKKQESIRASQEVLVFAGTIQTPQLPELSSIGNRTVLEEAGIKYLVENDGVGEKPSESSDDVYG
jgi:choline dehydrogenase-like flavoprotein